MKIKHINKRFIPALAIVMGLSSCLKDKNPDLDFSKLKPVVEISVPITTDTGVPSPDNSGDGAANTFSYAFVAGPDPIAYQIPVNYAYSKPSPGVNVTLAVDPTVLAKYNDIEGTDLEILPSANYSIPNLKVNIASGSQVAYLPINFVKTNSGLDGNKSYALPIRITDASGTEISGNYGSVIILLTIKNQYDATYATSGTRTRFNGGTVGSGVLDSFSISGNVALKTLNGTTVIGQAGDSGSGYTWALQVDAATNKVTVLPNPRASASGTPTAFIQGTTAGSSTYDPATKTFEIHCGYLTAAGGLRQIDEKLVRN
ncbi:DUF1735 domain-containing protein [Mucilaginibacter sp. CAU 1740]|uniref:BT_3987 domain-containing protein n=1 Tax=Mucilaginibacter sp. CAU 1740 TaxID=3140365 RepID=UPI00325A9AE6